MNKGNAKVFLSDHFVLIFTNIKAYMTNDQLPLSNKKEIKKNISHIHLFFFNSPIDTEYLGTA